MLPDIRQADYLFSIPKLDINKDDVETFFDELKCFHQNFDDCFSRSELRDHLYNYMSGQFSGIERKSVEPIALNIKNGKPRPMQRFISDAEWDDQKLLTKYRSLISDDMGDADGAIIFDETGFVKKGDHSAGVAKQYCGTIGKVDNCQVGVFASYVTPRGYSLLDKRLYIPQKWFTKEYDEKREKCKFPEELEFMTKPELAVEMLDEITKEKVIPYKYVLADSIYGESPGFIEAVESIIGVTYFVSVGSDTKFWLKQPSITEKEYKYNGEVRTKMVLKKGEKKPISVKSFAKNLNNFFWYHRTVSEGTKGPITYEFTKRKVILSNDGLPSKTVWLVIRRTLGDNPKYNYYLSNAPESVRLETFVWLSGLRWSIEQIFEETKKELGMDHYEVRKYKGWNHHIMICMLGHYFLWHLKIKLEKKSTIYYFISIEGNNRACFTFEAKGF
ncbi:DDE endonuclease [Candidatus Magnetomorum sp. HK-1]|nr:DDE endonuclease [Candidatus Magnetomorum sp. HK-1]